MCERRSRKIRKGSQLTRMRESRRLQRLRLQLLLSPSAPAQEEAPVPFVPPPPVDKNAQCRLILELALKTISLMQKNNLIQQRIIALQKETSDFVAAVMRNTENKRRYIEHMRVNGQPAQSQLNMPLKLDP